ncbi:MAG: hypothetical protein RR053_04155 [Evtepia sp.]
MTLADIAAIPKDFLTPQDVALYLQMDPQVIRILSRDAPERLLFPVIRSGNRTKIPKHMFIKTFQESEERVRMGE